MKITVLTRLEIQLALSQSQYREVTAYVHSENLFTLIFVKMYRFGLSFNMLTDWWTVQVTDKNRLS
jgi:hypothetical protein